MPQTPRLPADTSRPRFFNLLQIAEPVGAITSIAHRIAGVLLSLGLPAGMLLLHLSIRSAEDYARVSALLATPAGRAALLLFTWALAHHVLAGVRHLLMDIDLGSRLAAARRSAWAVNIGAVAVTLTVLAVLW